MERDVVSLAFDVFDFEPLDQVEPMITRLEGGFSGATCSSACIVGEEIEPGTYEATNFAGELFTDAYWEVTDSSGGIIANDLITSAQKVTVTIPAHAGQFTETNFGLGFWVKVG